MAEELIEVLVVEDNELVRRSIIAMLAREVDMQVVGTAVNGREAIQYAETLTPDVIIMDVSMPQLDGIRAAHEIKALHINSHIIMLSMHYNNVLVHEARKSGACAYIVKQEANKELIPAIRAAHEGTLAL